MKYIYIQDWERTTVALFAVELTVYIEKSKKILWSIIETNESSSRLLDIRSI